MLLSEARDQTYAFVDSNAGDERWSVAEVDRALKSALNQIAIEGASSGISRIH